MVRARHLDYFENVVWKSDLLSNLSRIRRDQSSCACLFHTIKSEGLDDPLRAQAVLGSLVHQVTIDSQFSLGEMIDLLRRYRNVDPDRIPATTLPFTVVRTYHWRGGSYGDVDMPAEPQGHTVIDNFLGAAPATQPPGSVSIDVSDVSGMKGHGVQVAHQLSALGFSIASTTQQAAPGQPAETVIR